MKPSFLKPDNTVKAVYEDKFESFLKNIGVYEKIISGTERCKFCNNVISMDNIASVFPESDVVKFVCDNPKCLYKMNSYLSDKQK